MMNERIKQLLQEAYTHFGHGKYRTPELVAEKFAELIVRDTLKVTGATPSMTESVKKHFGVE
jgi:hypothetical protein